MMRLFRILIAITLLALGAAALAPATPSAAQPDPTDAERLFFLMDGELYSYTPSTERLQQESTWGHNEAPSGSPDGTAFVYNSIATMTIEALEAGTLLPPAPMPSNIWYWDIPSDEATRIADQPPGAVPPSTADAGTGVIRSRPVFAPDGTRIAWSEAQLPDYDLRLVVYALSTGQTTTIATDIPLGFQDVSLQLPRMKWGSGGISILTVNIVGAGAASYNLTVYDLSGTIVFDRQVAEDPIGEVSNAIHDYVWLDDIPNTVALLYANGNMATLNIDTGNVQPFPGPLLMTSPAAPGGFRLEVTPRAPDEVNQDRFAWQYKLGDNTLFSFSTWNVDDSVALSPAGDTVAFAANGGLSIYGNNQFTLVPNTEALEPWRTALVWGPGRWQVSADVTADCTTTAPPPRLQAGMTARVVPGLGTNVLRGAPAAGPASAELAFIPEGAALSVLDGPVCSSGFYWWLVNWNGLTGWTAEGEAATYWLEPVQ